MSIVSAAFFQRIIMFIVSTTSHVCPSAVEWGHSEALTSRAVADRTMGTKLKYIFVLDKCYPTNNIYRKYTMVLFF